MMLRRQHRRRRAARDHRLQRAAGAHAAGQFEQLGEGRAQRHLEVAGLLHVADHREDLGAAVVGLADGQVLRAAVADDPRHRGEGLGVVDRRRLAVDAEAGRERRLEARLALLAFQRFEQRGFFAADVGAEAVEGMQLEVEAAAQDVVAQVAGGAGFVQRLFEALVDLEDLAVDVVAGGAHAHRVGGDGHALDDDVRVVGEDVAVLAGAGLAFVGIADQVLRAGVVLRHEAPLQAGGKARAAAAAQARGLDLGDHLVGRHAGAAVQRRGSCAAPGSRRAPRSPCSRQLLPSRPS